MTEESERTLMLLQELAALNDTPDSGEARRSRRKQIGEEIKQLARNKQQKRGGPLN